MREKKLENINLENNDEILGRLGSWGWKDIYQVVI